MNSVNIVLFFVFTKVINILERISQKLNEKLIHFGEYLR